MTVSSNPANQTRKAEPTRRLLTSSSSSPSAISSTFSSSISSSSSSFNCKRKEITENMNPTNLDSRSLLGDGLFDLGHPLLNCIAESFVKAAGIGAFQAVSKEAYSTAVGGTGVVSSNNGGSSKASGGKKHYRFPDLRGETNSKSLEAMVKNSGKESLQWGLAAGVYSGLTYGLREARGTHDWKNSAVAGALTGAAMALTSKNASHEQIVQCAITGAAVSTAANLLSGIF